MGFSSWRGFGGALAAILSLYPPSAWLVHRPDLLSAKMAFA